MTFYTIHIYVGTVIKLYPVVSLTMFITIYSIQCAKL